MDREAWIAAHRGKLTASEFQTLMSGRAEKGQRALLARLRAERDGAPLAFWASGGSAATDWGHRYEAEARELFQIATGLALEAEPGLILHPDLPDVGASPDALVLDANRKVVATAEIKCPYDANVHAKYRATGMPEKYRAQTQGQMWCVGVGVAYFISFDPRADDGRGDLFYEPVERDAGYIQRLERKVRDFLELLESGAEPAAFDPTAGDIPDLF